MVVAALVTGLVNKERQSYANYYHMMNDEMYADFVWLGQHGGLEGKAIMMEPSLAWAYPPVAGPGSVVWAAIASPWSANWADQFREVLATGEVETEWLRQEDAWVVYTCLPGGDGVKSCTELKNSDLPEIRPGIYLVPAQEPGTD